MKTPVWIIGFPRCGTVSLCEALRMLGWNPFHNPRHWDMLEGHDASGDVFITAHWRDLWQMYPHAKFILNTRRVEDWLESLKRIPLFWFSPLLHDQYHRLAVYGTQDVNDEASLRAAWKRHHDEVQATIPRRQLLVFPLPFSWRPLCEFLGVEAPIEPFPWKNRCTSADASAHLEGVASDALLRRLLRR